MSVPAAVPAFRDVIDVPLVVRPVLRSRKEVSTRTFCKYMRVGRANTDY